MVAISPERPQVVQKRIPAVLRSGPLTSAGFRDAQTLRIPLTPVDTMPAAGRSEPCPHCGSHGFTMHQRSWKRIKDVHVHQVAVDRYRCKRCGWVGRTYPTGVGPGRQSLALRELSLLLYGTGLSLAMVRLLIERLGCRVSETTIRNNVEAVNGDAPVALRAARMALRQIEDGTCRLTGPDGALTLSIGGTAVEGRWLEVQMAGAGAAELRWRFEDAERWVRTVLG